MTAIHFWFTIDTERWDSGTVIELYDEMLEMLSTPWFQVNKITQANFCTEGGGCYDLLKGEWL